MAYGITRLAISPDARRVIYGSVVTGKRGGAEVDVSALWIANANDGSGAARLTACPGSVCDEHGAAWSPDGTQVAFVTTDAKEQTQVAIATVGNRDPPEPKQTLPIDHYAFRYVLIWPATNGRNIATDHNKSKK